MTLRSLTPGMQAQLVELGEITRQLRYAPAEDAEPVRMERDGLIYKLMREGVSPTAIARASGLHRVLLYRIEKNYPGRKRKWQEQERLNRRRQA